MKRSSRHIVSSRKSTALLGATALASARGGLVSNFNRLVPTDDDVAKVATTPARTETDDGPVGMW